MFVRVHVCAHAHARVCMCGCARACAGMLSAAVLPSMFDTPIAVGVAHTRGFKPGCSNCVVAAAPLRHACRPRARTLKRGGTTRRAEYERRAGYRAVRDAVPCAIPCRAGYDGALRWIEPSSARTLNGPLNKTKVLVPFQVCLCPNASRTHTLAHTRAHTHTNPQLHAHTLVSLAHTRTHTRTHTHTHTRPPIPSHAHTRLCLTRAVHGDPDGPTRPCDPSAWLPVWVGAPHRTARHASASAPAHTASDGHATCDMRSIQRRASKAKRAAHGRRRAEQCSARRSACSTTRCRATLDRKRCASSSRSSAASSSRSGSRSELRTVRRWAMRRCDSGFRPYAQPI